MKLSFKKTNEFLNFEQIDGHIKIASISSMEIKELNYKYDESIPMTYENYKFSKGNIYIISVANGAGKTTLLQLLTRELNAEHNSIFMDSHDIKHLVSKDYITRIILHAE